MKQTPEIARVQERMRPGELTLHGFLGSDTRSLADILAADGASVAALGTTHAALADSLAALAARGQDIAERPVELDGRYTVRVRDDRGLIPSPWGDGLFAKGDVEMTDSVTGLRFRWNPLTLHLIRAHGFYGGKGSPYRLEPRALAAALQEGDDQSHDQCG